MILAESEYFLIHDSNQHPNEGLIHEFRQDVMVKDHQTLCQLPQSDSDESVDSDDLVANLIPDLCQV